MDETSGLILKLREEGEIFFSSSETRFRAELRRIEDASEAFFVFLEDEYHYIGFASIEFDLTQYALANIFPELTFSMFPSKGNPLMPDLETMHGVYLIPEFRNRNLGHALLSLGIGVAQRDYNVKGLDPSKFLVTAGGIEGVGKKDFYEKFGFETVLTNSTLLRFDGYYRNPYHVKPIALNI